MMRLGINLHRQCQWNLISSVPRAVKGVPLAKDLTNTHPMLAHG